MSHNVGLGLALALLASGCSEHKGPPVNLLVAHAAQGDRCAAPAPAEAFPDERVTAAGITHVRVSIVSYDPGSAVGTFRCDRVFDTTSERFLKLELQSAEKVDIFVEGFREAPSDDPDNPRVGRFRRVATGALFGVPVTAQTVGPLRLYPVEQFRCVNRRLERPRAFHTATALPNGQVLVAGGVVAHPTDAAREDVEAGRLYLTSTVEIWDGATATFVPVMDPGGTPRAMHHATLLDDKPPYRVLLVGGATTPDPARPAFGPNNGATAGGRLIAFDQGFPPPPLPTRAAGAEIVTYDPVAKTITREVVTGLQPAAMQGAAAMEGGFAVVGGQDWAQGATDDFTPSRNAQLRAPDGATATGLMLAPRVGATLTATFPGEALVWGGLIAHADPAGEVLATMQGGMVTTTAAPLPGEVRRFHTATRFAADEMTASVLVTGGFELAAAGGAALQPPALDGAARVLSIVRGGAVSAAPVVLDFPADSGACDVAERYRPAGWEAALLLRQNGKVLVTGGSPQSDGACPGCETTGTPGLLCATRQAAMLEPPSTLRRIAPMQLGRFGHTATELLDGTVLILGGIAQPGAEPRVLAEAEVYNPRAAVPRFDQAAPGMNDADDPLVAFMTSLGLQRAPGDVARHPMDLSQPALACPEL